MYVYVYNEVTHPTTAQTNKHIIIARDTWMPSLETHSKYVHVLMRDERKKQAWSKMYMCIDLSVWFVGYSSPLVSPVLVLM